MKDSEYIGPALIKKTAAINSAIDKINSQVSAIINQINTAAESEDFKRERSLNIDVRDLSYEAEKVLRSKCKEAGWKIKIEYNDREFHHIVRLR